MAFGIGEEVEVCSREDGFLGSYYAATVVAHLENMNMYIVQYKELLKNDESGPLIERVLKNEVRPVPLEMVATDFSYLDKVDAYDNDGWWVGKITGKEGSNYNVYFETTGEEIAYPVSRLRFHLDWCSGKWVSTKKSLVLSSSNSTR
ncbi:protein AGENET DOMAIN (AGD)-CONTAINING P1 [Ziziphus jujuba]|uniref:Protein AGENET DOMAIN (AGD)-CONTAINING P1 n=1 Tax=Ziziphus jujuba TaxID=326968 RepID=A0A6P4A212_ZIZJJ|nr:protein AGENET DOMAIN (AGD)-CONTAINING P1 [Ziziphus jujuba]